MDTKTVSILGCGWLGFPLARRLVQSGFSVNGSTTSSAKLALLEEAQIRPFRLSAKPELCGDNLDAFFDAEVLFLNIPFRRNLKDPRQYYRQIEAVVSRVQESPVRFVIFASSTSVYPSSLANAAEDAVFEPEGARAATLTAIERLLLNNAKFDATVIRFAGLYGGERQIGRILAGRTGVPDPDAPVNLIHLDDCVEIVTRVIRQDIRGEIFNACSDGHPARREIYTRAAAHYGLKPPQFTAQRQTRFKIVNNTKIKARLGISFLHPDPMTFE